MSIYRIETVTPQNISKLGLYCIKNQNAEGYREKRIWYETEFNNGLRIKIAFDSKKKQLGFIEYIPSEFAWRPVIADNFLFIHCIMVHAKRDRDKQTGSGLLSDCENDARNQQKNGVCALSSSGTWIANQTIFEKNGYQQVDKRGRFELMAKIFNESAPVPFLNNWEAEQSKYRGWHLVYADQCPWHNKSVLDLSQTAKQYSINLQVTKINTAVQAQQAPSGFGVFSLIKDGKLLADHYISKTRFENILKKELNK